MMVSQDPRIVVSVKGALCGLKKIMLIDIETWKDAEAEGIGVNLSEASCGAAPRTRMF